jgi:hypothetical protein
MKLVMDYLQIHFPYSFMTRESLTETCIGLFNHILPVQGQQAMDLARSRARSTARGERACTGAQDSHILRLRW